MGRTGQRKRPAAAGLSQADYVALAAFRRGLRQYLDFAGSGARSAGLTPHQHQALLALKAHPGPEPLSIGGLADELLVKNHSAVELVGRLVKAGLARRAEAPDDRRRIQVTLTDKGEQILASLSENNMRELRLFAPLLSGLLDRLERLETSTGSEP